MLFKNFRENLFQLRGRVANLSERSVFLNRQTKNDLESAKSSDLKMFAQEVDLFPTVSFLSLPLK